MSSDPLTTFTAPVRDWFRRTFEQPTRPRAGLAADRGGQPHAAAGADRLGQDAGRVPVRARRPRPRPRRARHPRALRLAAEGAEPRRRAQPARAARRHRRPRALPRSRCEAATRPQRERAAIRRDPPDILITTPESLYLMLTSAAREVLARVETVIVDEIHAVAATKRGAHLALSLERLEHLAGGDPQRIGLSATQRPLEEIARFLGGDRPVDDRRRRPRQAARPGGGGPGRRHARAGRRAGGRRRAAPVDLAGDLPARCWSWCGPTARRSCSSTTAAPPSGSPTA